MGKPSRIAFAVAVVAALAHVGPSAPPLQAAHCQSMSMTIPPSQGPNAVHITGNSRHSGSLYWGDRLGCVNGMEVADTRYLPPRSEYVIVVFKTRCTDGAVVTFLGSQVTGLGINRSNLRMTCYPGHALDPATAFVTEQIPINPADSGTITARIPYGGTTYVGKVSTLNPVDFPA